MYRYASFWLPTNTQPSFSQYVIQQCVTLVMRRFSYQQIRHLTVHYSSFDPRANVIKLKLLCTNTFVTTFKHLKSFKNELKRLCCNVDISRFNTFVYGVQSKSVYLVSAQKFGKYNQTSKNDKYRGLGLSDAFSWIASWTIWICFTLAYKMNHWSLNST